ncbi:GyrI-like domain-containing protein [Microbacterium sp. E-13]|uniref:GyrI-like domain-containing protein n=1 Tax=Microbacterium sp. E-13 TaxID=3404048 RepID=UPI003CEB365A
MTAEIEVAERAETLTAGMRRTVPMHALTEFFSHALSETIRVLTAQGLQPSGPPFGKYYGMPGTTVDVEAGFPVAAPVAADGEVAAGTLPGGQVVEAVHVGPYETMASTYTDIERFFAARGWTPGDVMWESYLSDPGSEPDPRTWRTLITWPRAGGDSAIAT